MRTMHLFAGAGGGLLADLILGHQPVVAVEWDKYACAVLRARATDGWFPGLQVWEGDVCLFDPSEYTGRVDCIHAGFPCQDISTAGNGAGVHDGTRSGLYREVLRIADVVRPRYIFLENVAAISSNGLGTVLGDFSQRGYDGRWTNLAASDVGAPHQRNRWWCLMWRSDTACAGEISRCTNRMGDDNRPWRNQGQFEGIRSQEPLADSDQEGLGKQTKWSVQQQRRTETLSTSKDGNGSQNAFNSDSAGCKQQRRTITDEKTNPPVKRGSWWSVEPQVGRMVDGMAHRSHQLACLGNGQVPLCAAAAWKILGGP